MRCPRRLTLALAPVLAPVLAVPLLVAVAPLSPSSAGEVATSRFIDRTNDSRHNHGLRSLAIASDLMTIAQQHAQAMARHHDDYHNGGLTSEVCCWQDVGENVGKGPSVKSIHYAFMHSYEHRSNILSKAYTQIGIGTARDSSGLLYVDEVFRRPRSASTSSMQTASTPGHPRPQHVPVHAAGRPGTVSRSSARAPLSGPVLIPPTFTDRLDAVLRSAEVRRWRAIDPVSSAIGWARLLARVHRSA